METDLGVPCAVIVKIEAMLCDFGGSYGDARVEVSRGEPVGGSAVVVDGSGIQRCCDSVVFRMKTFTRSHRACRPRRARQTMGWSRGYEVCTSSQIPSVDEVLRGRLYTLRKRSGHAVWWMQLCLCVLLRAGEK